MDCFAKIVNNKLFSKINVYLLVFFVVRLFHITNPPLEVAHNWRQTTVTMVARNFYEINPNIFYPRLDFAGTKTGITGMEFPLLSYLIYLMSLVFGYEHWYGRLINLIISTLGIYCFHALIKRYFSWRIALYASLILLFSIWFAYSRKIMPDTFSFSFMIMAIYFGTSYFEYKKTIHLMLYSFFCLIGLLTKLPSGYILIVFSTLLINPKYDTAPKLLFLTSSVLLFVPVAYWYFYWVPHLNQTFHFSHVYMGTSLQEGLCELINHLMDTSVKFFDNAIKYIGFVFFMFGIYKAYQQKNKKVLHLLILACFGFFIVMLKAGFAFHHHNYYIIPFVPMMALVCAYGITQLKNKKWHAYILIAIATEGVLNAQDDFFIKKNNSAVYHLERDLNSIGHQTDLIVINSGKVPTPMYFAHRKGEMNDNNSLLNDTILKRYKAEGYKYVVILKQSFGSEIHPNLHQKINNPYYAVYQF